MTTVRLVLIAAAAWRAIKHRRRRQQVRIMRQALYGSDRGRPPTPIYARLRSRDALAFEELLLESFRRRWHRVIRHRPYTGDGGVDGHVVIDGRVWLIQAKRYATAIRPEHVRAFAALCAMHGTPGLLFTLGASEATIVMSLPSMAGSRPSWGNGCWHRSLADHS